MLVGGDYAGPGFDTGILGRNGGYCTGVPQGSSPEDRPGGVGPTCRLSWDTRTLGGARKLILDRFVAQVR